MSALADNQRALVFRAAVYEDVPAIKKVADAACYTKHFSHPAYCNRPKFAAGQVVVGVLDDTIIAFAVLSISKRSANTEIVIFGVHPDYHRQGIGRKLLEFLVSYQKNPVLVLEVHKVNEGAVAFYQGAGFRIVGQAPNGVWWRMRWVCKRGVLM